MALQGRSKNVVTSLGAAAVDMILLTVAINLVSDTIRGAQWLSAQQAEAMQTQTVLSRDSGQCECDPRNEDEERRPQKAQVTKPDRGCASLVCRSFAVQLAESSLALTRLHQKDECAVAGQEA
ncbi:hypothetical protein LIA77_04747 [Sarocladium implicatum]|nr:hypothetical protein LIA77_04747 [Sarocladium implicatum]